MYIAGIDPSVAVVGQDRHRGRRTAIVGAAAAAAPILALGNQWMENWRTSLRDLPPNNAQLSGFGVRSYLGRYIDAFSWRFSGDPFSDQPTLHSEMMIGGGGALAASCLADAVAIALVGLLLWLTARTWRPGISALAVFLPAWGVTVIACVLSGLVIPALFGADQDIYNSFGLSVFLLGGATERAAGGLLLGIFVAMAVMAAQAVHNARRPGADATLLAGTDPLPTEPVVRSPGQAPPMAGPEA